MKLKGYKNITLLGQNVNSYGADLILGEKNIQVLRDLDKTYFDYSSVIARTPNTRGTKQSQSKEIAALTPFARNDKNSKTMEQWNNLKPVYVKHLGRYRIPTLFPYLLEQVAKLDFAKVDFISSNPWDFSDELIDVIARNKNITRTIHLPIQSGDNKVLKRMNRWYTSDEYLKLVANLKFKIKNLKLSTDIIVGFCGETDAEFQNTVKLAKLVGYEKAYISMYSQRPLTAATKVLKDDIPHALKKHRWQILEDFINKPNLKKN